MPEKINSVDTPVNFLHTWWIKLEKKALKNKLIYKLIHLYRIFHASSKKFFYDDCFTKASAIAYTTLISLIPTLTVIFTFYSIFSGVGDKKEEIFRKINMMLVENNIKLDLSPFLEVLSSLIENAAKIGGIGIIIVIFSATAVLRTIENSLNSIWKIEEGRSISLQFIYYWAVLTLAPIILIGGSTLSAKLSGFISAPAYQKTVISQNDLWVVGSQSVILKNGKKILLSESDIENQEVYDYDPENKTFNYSNLKIDESERFQFHFNSLNIENKTIRIVGNDGILISSKNQGKSWQVKKLSSFDFTDIYMIDKDTGFITAENGYVLSTQDAGENWEVKQWKELGGNWNSITFYGKTGIITGDRGMILLSKDKGESWSPRLIKKSLKNSHYSHLNAAAILNNSDIWIAGNEGLILQSRNGGKSWKERRITETHYYSINYNKSANQLFIAGENGTVMMSQDNGTNWKRIKAPNYRINQVITTPSRLHLIGEPGLSVSLDKNQKWIGKRGKSFVVYLLNFITPFSFIWTFFLLLYMSLPNRKIPFKPAAWGATFTSTIWVIFILLFGIYTRSFAKGTFAIYGALAAIPILLLMVYSSALIMLFGAELSYTLSTPKENIKSPFSKKLHSPSAIFSAIGLCYLIYKKFEKGNGSSSYDELLKSLGIHHHDCDKLLSFLKKEKAIFEVEKGEFIPGTSSLNFSAEKIFSPLLSQSLELPRGSKMPQALTIFLERIRDLLQEKGIQLLKEKNFKELLDE